MSWKDNFPQEHRYFETENGILYNADCLDVMSSMGDKTINTAITSPPYNKGYYDKHTPHKTDNWRQRNIVYGDFKDNIDPDIYIKQQTNILNELTRLIKNEGSVFYNHKSQIFNHKIIFPEYVFKFNLRQIITWDRKSTPQISPVRFYPTAEYIFWITKTNIQPKFNNSDLIFDKEIWVFPPEINLKHPAPFPVKLPENCILATTDKNDIVLDCYMGIGTTALACEKLNRRWIGIEISEKYCKIAKQRLIDYNKQLKIF